MRRATLLDNQSTVDVFCNKKLLTNIRECNQTMTVKGTSGAPLRTNLQATLPGYHKPVWFCPDGMTNILSLKNVKEQWRVSYDCDASTFVVHRGEPDVRFKMHKNGLHIHMPDSNGVTFVNTVSGNKEGFSKRQQKKAKAARELYAKLAYPSIKDYKWAIMTNQIKNCPVTVEDIDTASAIWGKDIAALKGKTVRSKPTPVAGNAMKVPKDYLRLHQDVFLTFDLFYVAGIPFLITLSRKIDFTTCHTPCRQKA